jgi:Flp pilus assembly pilin Flp
MEPIIERLIERLSTDTERGQATAEYALVIVAAAAIALALVVWASATGTLSSLFDTVLAKVSSYV